VFAIMAKTLADLSVNLNKSWTHKKIVYDTRLSFAQSLIYQ